MSIVSLRTYSKTLPQYSIKHIYSVKKEDNRIIVRFVSPVPMKSDSDKFVNICEGMTWEDVVTSMSFLDFNHVLDPMPWCAIENSYNAWKNFSCQPKKKKLPENYVFDEDKSVKWNHEQVRIHNESVDKEVADLNRRKNELRDRVVRQAAINIQCEVRGKMPYKKAVAVWDYAYKKADYEYSFKAVLNEIEELMKLIKAIYDVEEYTCEELYY